MNSFSRKVLFWTPRLACLGFAIFLSLFALDVFSEGNGFWKTILGLLIHLGRFTSSWYCWHSHGGGNGLVLLGSARWPFGMQLAICGIILIGCWLSRGRWSCSPRSFW